MKLTNYNTFKESKNLKCSKILFKQGTKELVYHTWEIYLFSQFYPSKSYFSVRVPYLNEI